MRCLVAGASGLVGGGLLSLLLDDSRVLAVTSVGRRELAVGHPKLSQVVCDLDRIESTEIPSVDTAFCTLGTTIKKAGSQAAFRKVDHDYVLNFARAAKKAGAKKFLIVTAMGADAKSNVFYNRVKGEVERELIALQFESLVIFRPSLLLGHRSEIRIGEKIAITLSPVLSPLLFGPLKAYRPIEAERVARAMIEYATQETDSLEFVDNATIHLIGDKV